MMANKTVTKEDNAASKLSEEQSSDELARCRLNAAASKTEAEKWAKRLDGHAERTIPALLVWARHAREAGRWTAAAARLSSGDDQPKEAANVDYRSGQDGLSWRRLTDVIFERTGYPSDGVGLNDLSIMAECGKAVQGRDDLKGAYREFVTAVAHLDVDQLIADLQDRFPVMTADLPKPPAEGEWSTWMNKRDVEDLLNCEGRQFDTLYPSEIEHRGRQRWRFRLDVRDEEVRRRYRSWLERHGRKKR